MPILSPLTALIAACAVSGWILARRGGRWSRYRPIAALVTWLSLTDLARAAIQALWLLYAPMPYVGAVAVAFHVEQALALSWPVALVAAAVAVFLRRRPAILLAPWAALSVGFSLAYPWLRLARRDTAHAIVTTATVIAVAACAAWSWRTRRDRWSAEHLALGAVVASEFAVAAVVLWWPDPRSHWGIARFVHGAVYSLLLAGQVWHIRRLS